MDFSLNPTAQAILMLIHGCMTRKGKQWNLISQSWMLEQLKNIYGISISRSCLNYNLATLRSAGYLVSVKRHIRGDYGQLVCRVTLYKMTQKLRLFFVRLNNYFRQIRWVTPKKWLSHRAVLRITPPTYPHDEDIIDRSTIREFIDSLSDPDLPLGFSQV